jgi:uncharacterized membrane protein
MSGNGPRPYPEPAPPAPEPTRTSGAGPAAERSRECPRCGHHSPADAVFCEVPACRKALGEFRYSAEELAAGERWHTALADRVTGFIAHPVYIVVHVVWFALWVAVNTGLVMVWRRFDAYPFALLGILLAVEAIFITGFVLISQTRQGARADLRAELDYEVNVRTYRELTAMHDSLRAIAARVEAIEALLPTAGAGTARRQDRGTGPHG